MAFLNKYGFLGRISAFAQTALIDPHPDRASHQDGQIELTSSRFDLGPSHPQTLPMESILATFSLFIQVGRDWFGRFTVSLEPIQKDESLFWGRGS